MCVSGAGVGLWLLVSTMGSSGGGRSRWGKEEQARSDK